MSKGVFTRIKRFTLVEKTSGEVGDGTGYPILVTRDQLAEIMYRSRKMDFTQGSVTFQRTRTQPDGSIITEDASISVTTGIALATNVSDHEVTKTIGEDIQVGSMTVQSGYHTDALKEGVGGYSLIPPWEVSAGTVGYMGGSLGLVFDPKSELSIYGGRISKFDPAMLSYDYQTAFYLVNTATTYSNDIWDAAEGPNPGSDVKGVYTFTPVTHFKNEGLELTTKIPASLSFYRYRRPYVSVTFNINRQVAYVDNDGSNNPFSPMNLLYVAASLSVLTAQGYRLTTSNTLNGGTVSAECNLILRLSSSDVSCPLYLNYSTFDTDSIVPSASYDFIAEATEWWPYAKNSPAVPVWDAVTGLKL